MSASTEAQNSVFGGKAAAVLGAVFLFLFLLVALFGAVDRAHRTRLEVLESPSAVGDPVVFVLPQAPAARAQSLMVRDGVELFFVKYEGHEDTLRKAGTDDSGKIPLYRRLKDDNTFKEGYRVKLAPGIYAVLAAKKS